MTSIKHILLKGQTACLLFCVLCISQQDAFAWGWTHRLIAYMAQEHCTPTTRAEMDKYLDAPLNYYASWLDQFRCAPWKDGDYSKAPDYTFKAWEHAVSVDENCRPLEYSNRSEGNGEGYGAFLKYYNHLLHYKDMPDSAVVVDLKAMIHVIGDVHCPGHILYSHSKEVPDTMGGGIAGGYGIWQHMYCGKPMTLHALLDKVEYAHNEFNLSLDKWQRYIDTCSIAWQQEAVRGWMPEYIRDAAERSKVIYDWVKPGEELDETFFTQTDHEQLIVYLTQVAAYRTAHVLNTIFDPGYRGVRDDGFALVAANATVEGAPAPAHKAIEGVIVNDPASLNGAANPQTAWNSVDASYCHKVLYIENLEGTCGIKVELGEKYAKWYTATAPKQFSRVRISLDGCTLRKLENPERYVVEGVEKVQVLEENYPVKVRSKHISELGADDVFTLVELRDVEFYAKEGSYTNARELNLQPTIINSFKQKSGMAWFDECGTRVKDSEGSSIFLPVNSVCDWRRRGDKLPAGVGSIRGVVVCEELPRSGVNGELALRISGPQAVSILAEEASSYDEIVAWRWDRNYYDAINCVSGEKKWLEGAMVPCEAIRSESGNGVLKCSCAGEMGLEKEFNSRSAQDGWTAGEGSREKAAVVFSGKMSAFAGREAGVTVEFSTRGIIGKGLSFDLSWVAGNGTDKYVGAPQKWQLSYSVDGGRFITAQKVLALRDLAWAKGSEVPFDAATGYVENTVLLPAAVLGHDKVVIKISPLFETKPSSDANMYLRIGKIVASALK